MPPAPLPEELRLEDPRSLRAVAHPARQRVLHELYAGGRVNLTAAQAGELCGLSTAAMSYHLRALERFGIIARSEVSADRRERPWRAVAHRLVLDPPRAGLTHVPASSFSGMADQLADGLARWGERPGEPDGFALGVAVDRMSLTREESRELSEGMAGLVREIAGRRTPTPDAAVRSRLMVQWAILPADDPEAAGTAD